MQTALYERLDVKNLTPQPKAYYGGPYTVEASGYKPVAGETIPRRHPSVKDGLVVRPNDRVATIYDIVKYSSEKFGNAKALGHRKLIQKHEEVKQITKKVDGKEVKEDKKWTYYELSGYEYMSFVEYEKLVLKVGSGFRSLGMEKNDRVHIFASTSPWWLAISHGAASQSMPIVTAYDTLGEEGLTHSLNQTHAKAIFLDPSLLTKLINPLKSNKDIQHVIYNSREEVKQADIDKLKAAHDRLTIISFDDFVKQGEQHHADPVPPTPEDLCCIMYTSGSTGTPKGVLLRHSTVIAGLAGADSVIGQYVGPGDGLLTYLPLAHILEFVFENACLYWGGTMGYANPKTISDNSTKNCAGDIREFKPSIMVGVPAVWETVRKGVVAKVSHSSIVLQQMFWAAMSAKNMMLNTGLPGSGIGAGVLDNVVFKKVKDATGGRLRICMSGGGPISKETQNFISMAIAPMIVGYGLTETTGMGALTDPLAWTDNAIGSIPGSAEVKLVDFPDAGYYATNKPPQGEVWIRGASVAAGYLDLEKETKENFTDDGWFKTGDIGEFDKQGNLRIIDRKKNLVKMQGGEYVALEKLESVYRSATIVLNICVHAAQDKYKPIAIIVPNEAHLKSVASQVGVEGNLDDLCHNKKVINAVLKDLQAAGKKGGLSGFELLEGLVLSSDEWTPQNGLITSAQKLNRRGIADKYKKEVQEAYS